MQMQVQIVIKIEQSPSKVILRWQDRDFKIRWNALLFIQIEWQQTNILVHFARPQTDLCSFKIAAVSQNQVLHMRRPL